MYQRECMENSVGNMKPDWLMLLFTCNGVGVVIRSVRLKIWSSENSILKKKMETFWFFWLWFCHTYDFASNSNFWFSLSHKHSCGSPYDFDSDFVASENQPLLSTHKFCRLISTIPEGICRQNFLFEGEGGGGEWGYANLPIRYDLLTKSALQLLHWIQNPGKKILITRKVQNLGPKIYESTIHCDCRIQKSIKMSLWIWHPGKNIFKIRQSIRLFIPFLFGSHFINNYSHNCFSILHIDIQGCALAEPGGPWHLTFALGWLENLPFFIQIICWAP